MGSGKSTHGRKLASALKTEYVDLDIYITQKLNKTIHEIFENFGEQFFRDQETEAIKDIIAEKKEPTVISLGGGAICFNDNIKLVKKNGLIIYLETHENILRQRLLRSKNKRPLLKDMSEEEVLSFIKTKVKERSKFYDQAHIKINGLNLTTAVLIKALEEYYKK
ncbi:MAG: shikimate kinase [Sphingobacteriaceae bacterium]|nr:shikimate kinase [Sphingobacteriaceae bacterium]